MASSKSVHIDKGTANQRYRFDLLQDVADQVRYMLTSGAHVTLVAGGSEHPEGALPVSSHSRWRPDALQPLQIQRGSLDRNTCVHIPDGDLRCVTWNTRGLLGSVISSQISR